nr:hypothetical protein [Vibrio vulnificus]
MQDISLKKEEKYQMTEKIKVKDKTEKTVVNSNENNKKMLHILKFAARFLGMVVYFFYVCKNSYIS